jgi:putative oxidoreductase
MDNLKEYLAPVGRLLMSSLFIWAGIGKLTNISGTIQGFGGHYHIPLPEVATGIAVIVELGGGLLLLVGFKTRWAAAVLAIWCLITGFAFHLPAGDLPNMINFYKNLVMAGGFLYVVANGAGSFSIDGKGA